MRMVCGIVRSWPLYGRTCQFEVDVSNIGFTLVGLSRLLSVVVRPAASISSRQ